MENDDVKALAKVVSQLAGVVEVTADAALDLSEEVQRQGRTLDNIEKICEVLRQQNLELSRQIEQLARDDD